MRNPRHRRSESSTVALPQRLVSLATEFRPHFGHPIPHLVIVLQQSASYVVNDQSTHICQNHSQSRAYAVRLGQAIVGTHILRLAAIVANVVRVSQAVPLIVACGFVRLKVSRSATASPAAVFRHSLADAALYEQLATATLKS